MISCGGVEAGPPGECLAVVDGCCAVGWGFDGRAPLGALFCGGAFFVIGGGVAVCAGAPAAFLCGDVFFVTGGGAEGRAAPEGTGCFWDVFFASSAGEEGWLAPEAGGCFRAVCGAGAILGA